ncbi:MAG TPA: molybdopterin converting factor subunit 1 [Alphaproteobacteria bacterium]|nr:molybdopterin converting factor subunit 1 [Alphaproteobacteria bacterium]
MKLLYFAWLKQRTGVAEEEVTLPASVTDVAGLVEWLRGRGPGYAAALKNPAVIRVAVNQEYVSANHPVRPGDEVALFPPVTGG